MSDGVEFDWDAGESPEELAAKLERLDEVLEEKIEDAVNTIVTKIAADASSKAPYRDGWLSGHIRGVVLGWVGNVLEAVVGTKVEYGPYQEYGDDKFDVEFEANPYLRPAIRENRDWAYEQLEDAIEDAHDEVF